MATPRGAYVRKTETLRENYCGNKPELDDQVFADLREACTAFLDRPREAAKPPEPKHFRRQWQRPVRESLAELLARCTLAEGIESGVVKPASNDTTGWELQVFDGDIQGKLALV